VLDIRKMLAEVAAKLSVSVESVELLAIEVPHYFSRNGFCSAVRADGKTYLVSENGEVNQVWNNYLDRVVPILSARNKTARIEFRVTPAFSEWIKSEANARGITVSDMIQEAFIALAEKEGRETDTPREIIESLAKILPAETFRAVALAAGWDYSMVDLAIDDATGAHVLALENLPGVKKSKK